MPARKALYTILLCAVAAHVAHAARIGEWTVFPAYKDATRNVVAGEWIYSLSSSNLYRYNAATSEVQLFSRQNGLNDAGISHIDYCRAERCLVIVYENANIDLLHDNGDVTNIPQLRDSELTEKTVNNLDIEGSQAYIALSGGVEVVDVAEAVLANYYAVGNTLSTTVFDGRLYASTTDGILCGSLTDNLLDSRNWTVADRTLTASWMVAFRGYLYAAGTGGGIYRIDRNNTRTLANGHLVNYLHSDGTTYMLAGNATRVLLFDADEELTEWQQANDFNDVTRTASGTYWASRGLNGLQAYAPDAAADTLAAQGTPISPDSPAYDYSYYMTYAGDTLLVAGGSLNYAGIDYPGTFMRYAAGSWYNFPDEDISRRANTNYLNLTSVMQDPADPAHHFATAAGGGLFEYRDGHYVACHNLDNSPLRAMQGNDRRLVRTDGLAYDTGGNLWMINNEVDTMLQVMRPDGSWKGFYDPEFTMLQQCERILIDSRGLIWVTSRRTAQESRAGLYCLNLNGTFEDESDDQSRFRTSAYNEDGTLCTFSITTSVAEDHSGQIWFGTATGPYRIDRPEEWMDESFTVTQVKVPRNDGTNYADYLLAGVPINAIAVDGNDRKWFGTASDGVFVTSPDGLTTIHHFTTENSPLPSDLIYSIAVNEQTGDVMIGTDRGIVAYHVGTEAENATIDADNIRVYPNPVRPGYYGRITITGLPYGADVKITTTGGRVVAGGTAADGTFTWDGRGPAGNRVASGVYIVMTATADGKKGAAAKITIIR